MDKFQTILVDLDGVVVNSYTSNPYVKIEDFDSVAFNKKIPNFKANVNIIHLLYTLSEEYRLVFLTARQEFMRKNTTDWLKKYGFCETIIMRPTGDLSDDASYKLKAYREQVKGIHEVIFIIDDKPAIIKAFWDKEKIPGFTFTGGMYETS